MSIDIQRNNVNTLKMAQMTVKQRLSFRVKVQMVALWERGKACGIDVAETVRMPIPGMRTV